jgi:hypothetical protein
MMAKKKRNKGKRHKNRNTESFYESKGTGKRNRNSRICTHFDSRTGRQCQRRIHVNRGERALCEHHLPRHRKGCKTRAIIQHCQGNRFNQSMGDAP